jgi:hypothetical protein
MRLLAVLILVAGTVVGTAAAAQDGPERPVASLRLLSAPSDSQRWYGVGDVLSRSSLCVTSSTGRFQLTIQQLLASAAVLPGEVEIVMTTSAGDRQVASWDGQSQVVLSGRLSGDVCTAGGNVQVETRIRQRNLVAAVAGNYSARIRYSVDPA